MKTVKIVSKLLDVLSFGILLSVFVFFMGSYQKLPDRVVLNLGQVDMIWGSKLYFVALLWMAIISYGLLFILGRFLSKLFGSMSTCTIMAIYFMIILLLYFRANHITGDYGIYIGIVFALFGLLLAELATYITVARRIERRGKI